MHARQPTQFRANGFLAETAGAAIHLRTEHVNFSSIRVSIFSLWCLPPPRFNPAAAPQLAIGVSHAPRLTWATIMTIRPDESTHNRAEFLKKRPRNGQSRHATNPAARLPSIGSYPAATLDFCIKTCLHFRPSAPIPCGKGPIIQPFAPTQSRRSPGSDRTSARSAAARRIVCCLYTIIYV